MWASDITTFKPIVIYCLTMKQTLNIVRYLLSNGPNIFQDRIIRYHKDIESAKDREEIVAEFIKFQSEILILVTTTALGITI